MRVDETLYCANRNRFNELIGNGGATSEEAARLFFYFNRAGSNGLCRFNRAGEFKTPVGRYATISYPWTTNLYEA
jgi:DNA adenine methylase